jgi:hypothetical protein
MDSLTYAKAVLVLIVVAAIVFTSIERRLPTMKRTPSR